MFHFLVIEDVYRIFLYFFSVILFLINSHRFLLFLSLIVDSIKSSSTSRFSSFFCQCSGVNSRSSIRLFIKLKNVVVFFLLGMNAVGHVVSR